MIVLELSALNVRGFAPSVKVALRPGYTVLKPSGASPPPLAALVAALLYADGRGSDASLVAAGQKSGKAALTFAGGDQRTYRLIRDLGGSGALHALNREAKAFEPVSQDAAEIAQFLRGQAGVPGKAAFDLVFAFQTSQLPSRRPKPKAAGAAPAKPALASRMPSAAVDLAGAPARIAELEKERALGEQVDKLQFRLDGVSSQLFELEQKLKSTDQLKSDVAEAEAAWASAPTGEGLGLPTDIVQRAQRYAQAAQRRDDALAKLEAERVEHESSAWAPQALWRSRPFWAGAAIGGVLLGIGAGLHGLLRYVALLDIPAFGYAALAALRHVDSLQRVERESRKGGMRTAREKKILDDFESEARPVRAALTALKVETPADIAEVLGRKAFLGERVQQLREQLAAMEADPAFAQAAGLHQSLRQEQESLNAELTEKGAYVRDIHEVQREIARLKEALASGARSPAAKAEEAATPAEGIEDPCPALLNAAADLVQSNVPAWAEAVRERCAQYLTALTDRRCQGIAFDKLGKASVTVAGRPVPFTELPPKEADLAYLSLRMTVVEKLSDRVKAPLLWEEAMGVDETKLPLLSRMLKHLGTMGQVLQVSAHPAFGSVADASATV